MSCVSGRSMMGNGAVSPGIVFMGWWALVANLSAEAERMGVICGYPLRYFLLTTK
jgi:hypothetical protein